jgi:hypothetical protein
LEHWFAFPQSHLTNGDPAVLNTVGAVSVARPKSGELFAQLRDFQQVQGMYRAACYKWERTDVAHSDTGNPETMAFAMTPS